MSRLYFRSLVGDFTTLLVEKPLSSKYTKILTGRVDGIQTSIDRRKAHKLGTLGDFMLDIHTKRIFFIKVKQTIIIANNFKIIKKKFLNGYFRQNKSEKGG